MFEETPFARFVPSELHKYSRTFDAKIPRMDKYPNLKAGGKRTRKEEEIKDERHRTVYISRRKKRALKLCDELARVCGQDVIFFVAKNRVARYGYASKGFSDEEIAMAATTLGVENLLDVAKEGRKRLFIDTKTARPPAASSAPSSTSIAGIQNRSDKATAQPLLL